MPHFMFKRDCKNRAAGKTKRLVWNKHRLAPRRMGRSIDGPAPYSIFITIAPSLYDALDLVPVLRFVCSRIFPIDELFLIRIACWSALHIELAEKKIPLRIAAGAAIRQAWISQDFDS